MPERAQFRPEGDIPGLTGPVPDLRKPIVDPKRPNSCLRGPSRPEALKSIRVLPRTGATNSPRGDPRDHGTSPWLDL